MIKLISEDEMDLKFLEVLREFHTYNLNTNESQKVIKAYLIAKNLHSGVFRKSGDPYIIHPIEVAKIAVSYKVDCATVCACLLHDVVEDTDYTLKELEEEFGHDISSIVDGVTKISKMKYNEEELVAKNTRKLFTTALNNDIRIIAVKLFDRLHNMRTLNYMKPEKQEAISIQTFKVFAPLAEAIGANAIKKELHDLCFYYLEPDNYARIKEQIEKETEESYDEIMQVENTLTNNLNSEGIENKINLRIKNIYAVHTSFRKGRMIDGIHDLFALQIDVPEYMDCYHTLAIVHQNYKHLLTKLKCYLETPKTTGYRGLHTTILSPNQERMIQAQIRTYQMAITNSKGIIANLKKYNNYELEQLKSNYPFFSKVVDINNTAVDDLDFYSKVCTEVLGDKIYVRSLSNKVYELPVGSTILDFAFMIDPEHAKMITQGIIDGKHIDLDNIGKILHNQQSVGFVTGVAPTIDEDWLNKATTTRARRLIDEHLHNK